MTPGIQFTVGLDLAQDSFHAAIAWEPGQTTQWRKLPNRAFDLRPDSKEGVEALVAWLAKTSPEGVCQAIVIEATGPISQRFIDRVADTEGLPAPAMANPANVRNFGLSLGLREKTDAIDACVIALFGVIHRPAPVATRSKAERELRELNRLRESLVERRTAVSNAITAAIHESVREILQGELSEVEGRITAVDKKIKEVIAGDAVCHAQVVALQKIKGIGEITAITVTAELGDLTRYSRNALASIAGLFPRRRESGRTVWSPPKMKKGGGHRLRRVLFMCGQSILRSLGPLGDYARRMESRGLKRKAVIGAVMRKLLLIARAVMLNGGRYEPSKICKIMEATP